MLSRRPTIHPWWLGWTSLLLLDFLLLISIHNLSCQVFVTDLYIISLHLLIPSQFINTNYDATYDEAIVLSDIADHFLGTEEFAHYQMELIFNRKVDTVVSHKGAPGTISLGYAYLEILRNVLYLKVN